MSGKPRELIESVQAVTMRNATTAIFNAMDISTPLGNRTTVASVA
jgi:hypothetical protein